MKLRQAYKIVRRDWKGPHYSWAQFYTAFKTIWYRSRLLNGKRAGSDTVNLRALATDFYEGQESES